MIDMLKRHEIQVLRRAGHSQAEAADLAGVSESRRNPPSPTWTIWLSAARDALADRPRLSRSVNSN